MVSAEVHVHVLTSLYLHIIYILPIAKSSSAILRFFLKMALTGIFFMKNLARLRFSSCDRNGEKNDKF